MPYTEIGIKKTHVYVLFVYIIIMKYMLSILMEYCN